MHTMSHLSSQTDAPVYLKNQRLMEVLSSGKSGVKPLRKPLLLVANLPCRLPIRRGLTSSVIAKLFHQ